MPNELTLSSEEDTLDLAIKLERVLSPLVRAKGVLLGLYGELGSGKTTFSRYLAKAFGAEVPVSSPTFVLSHEYPCRGGIVIEHWDLYRVRGLSPQEIFEEQSAGKLKLVEWIEKDKELLQNADCVLSFSIVSETARRVIIKAPEGPILQAFLGIVSSRA